jgi:hypothetical protein
MTDVWYEEVAATTRLTQGDIILNCPLVAWGDEPFQLHGGGEAEVLEGMTRVIQADVIVMTQACDLEHEKVSNVVLCSHLSLTEYRQFWEIELQSRSQNPTQKAWRSFCEDVRDGYVWNLTILNSGSCTSLSIDHRIVDFHELYTVPRGFLESLLSQRGQSRLRLLPPYREHLSQAFARFFMRVGLPVGVTTVW